MKNKTLQNLLLIILSVFSLNLFSQNSTAYNWEKKTILQRSYVSSSGKVSTFSAYYNDQSLREIEKQAGSSISKIFSDEIIVITIGYGDLDTISWAVSIDRADYDLKNAASQNRLSPTNIPADIPWDDNPNMSGNQMTFGGPTYTAAAFDHGRRIEEDSMSFSPNVLGNLAPPNGLTNDNEGIYIMNSERICRSGIDYGNGNVLGLPFQDGEYNIDTLAQSHANYLIASNTFSHTGYGGSSPFDRINNNTKIGDATHCGISGGCHQFLNRAENIAGFWTSGSTNSSIMSRSIYMWIYADKNSSWGHREAALLQDAPLSGCCGFTNNFGPSDSEGFIGFGIAGANGYNPFNIPGMNHGDVVVMNFFDPLTSASANYTALNWNQSPMAVAMNYFTGKLEQNVGMLYWETLSEINNKMFLVERSSDGVNFNEIGYVMGVGNSVIDQKYTFTDNYLNDGVNYYRLKQMDYDNKYCYSKIVQIRKMGDKTIFVPSLIHHNQINVFSNYENYTAQIFTSNGKSIGNFDNLSFDQNIILENLTKGFYILKICSGNESKTFKFICE